MSHREWGDPSVVPAPAKSYPDTDDAHPIARDHYNRGQRARKVARRLRAILERKGR